MGQNDAEHIPASALALDFGIYPRTRLHRDRLMAMRARHEQGRAMRPVMVDSRTRQVIDGFHRVTMLLQGDTSATVPAFLKPYRDNRERWADAIRRNSHAGRELRLEDMRRCMRMAVELYPTPDAELAALMLVPAGHIAKLRTGELAEPAEVTVAEPAVAGWIAAHHADALRRLVEADAIDLGDAVTVERLRKLAAALLRVPVLFHRSGVPVAASE